MTLFQFYFLEFSAINILLGWSLYLPFRANQLYFGALYSMCIGGYIAAYTSVYLGWPLWLIIFATIAFCMFFSLIPALKLADLGGFTMLIATMALLMIVQTITRNLNFLGGLHGIFGLPAISRSAMLALTYGLLLVIGFFIYRLDYSYFGRAMDAMRLDKDVAGTLSIDVKRLSIQLQLASSVIGGITGVLYAFALGGIFPGAFSMSLVLSGMAIVTLGGTHTMWGIIIASPVLWVLSQLLPEGLKEFSIIVNSLVIIVVLIIRPSGIIDRKTVRMIRNTTRALMNFVPVKQK